MALNFETPVPANPPGILDGTATVQVLDPADPGTTSRLIETDDPFQVKVDWTIDGVIAPLVGGTWHVRAFLDDVDGQAPSSGQLGAEMRIPLNNVAPLPLPRRYSTTINIPANTVGAGLYQLNVVVTYENNAPGLPPTGPLSMAAFAESGVIEFYNKVDA